MMITATIARRIPACAFGESSIPSPRKFLRTSVGKVIFAVGSSAEKVRLHEGALIDVWAEKGIELSFLKISGILGTATAIGSIKERRRMASDIGNALDEMNAPLEVKELFARTFKKEET